MHLEREPGLRRAVAALGTAGGFVGERPRPLEFVARYLVGDGLQRSRVVGARHAVGAVAPAVQQRAEMHPGDRAVLRDTGLHPHQRRMPAAMAIEDLLAGQRDLHGTPGQHRELRDDDLVAERIALSPEAAAVGRGDDADARRRKLEHLGERPVDVVWCLRRAPQRDLAVGRPVGQRGVLLHRQVRVAFEEEEVLAHDVRRGEALFHVAELEVDELVEVTRVAVVVDARLGVGERVHRRADFGQQLVLDVDQVERRRRGLLGGRGDRGHGIADEAHLVHAQGVLVLADGEDPERDREVLPGEHRLHTVEALGSGRVDPEDTGVWMRAAQQPGVEHAGQGEVVGEFGRARDLGDGVHLAVRLSYDAETRALLIPGHTATPGARSRPLRACGPPPARRPRRS